jgi:hypothetical protein
LVRKHAPGAEMFVVADATPEWEKVCAKHNVTLRTYPTPGNSVLDGLKNAHELLEGADRVVVLLGDVIFSTWTMKQVLDTQSLIGLVGRETENRYTRKSGEIFALTLGGAAPTKLIYNTVTDAVWREAIIRLHNPGRLWDLKAKLDIPLFTVMPHDWTDDIDCPEDISNVLIPLRGMANVYD